MPFGARRWHRWPSWSLRRPALVRWPGRVSEHGVGSTLPPGETRSPCSALTSLMGMAKPIPIMGRPELLSSTRDTTTPTACPNMSSRGPPLLPGLTDASVCRRSVPLGRDDAPAHRRLVPQRGAQGEPDGDDLGAHPDVIGVADGYGRECLCGIDVDVGKVECGMGPGHAAPVLAARRHLDPDVGIPVDDMLVGDNQPALVDDEPRACAASGHYSGDAGKSVLHHVGHREPRGQGLAEGCCDLGADHSGGWRRRGMGARGRRLEGLWQ